jgi:hypothetical protein
MRTCQPAASATAVAVDGGSVRSSGDMCGTTPRVRRVHPGFASGGRALGAALLLVALLATGRGAQGQALEYQVKAVFLERFARFIEWPAGLLDDPAEPFRIEVLGDDPFGGLLEQAYARQTIRGRPVVVRHAARVAEIGACHLVFVSRSEAGRVHEVVERLGKQHVLLVGDTDGFGVAGVHLNFFLDGGKVRFELNEGALRRAGLKVSYLLQQVAVRVESKGEAP